MTKEESNKILQSNMNAAQKLKALSNAGIESYINAAQELLKQQLVPLRLAMQHEVYTYRLVFDPPEGRRKVDLERLLLFLQAEQYRRMGLYYATPFLPELVKDPDSIVTEYFGGSAGLDISLGFVNFGVSVSVSNDKEGDIVLEVKHGPGTQQGIDGALSFEPSLGGSVVIFYADAIKEIDDIENYDYTVSPGISTFPEVLGGGIDINLKVIGDKTKYMGTTKSIGLSSPGVDVHVKYEEPTKISINLSDYKDKLFNELYNSYFEIPSYPNNIRIQLKWFL